MPPNVPLTPEISISGEDDICPTFSLNLQISSFTVVSMDTEVTLGLHTYLGLKATLQESFIYPYSFKTLGAGPYVVLVGNVPVVLQPTLTPYVGQSGSASASAYTGLTTDSSLTIGASYANGAWGPVDTATSPSILATTTSVDGKLSVKADAGLQAGVTYGTVTGTQIIKGTSLASATRAPAAKGSL